MSENRKTYPIPSSAFDLARKLYKDIFALSEKRAALMGEYMAARADLETKFEGRSAALIEEINATKLQGSKAICEASGVPYSANNGYAIDTSYMEDHGVAFIQVVERLDGERFDGQMEDLPPPGTRLN